MCLGSRVTAPVGSRFAGTRCQNQQLHRGRYEHDHASFPVAIGCGRRRIFRPRLPGRTAENAPGVTDTEIKIGQTMPYSGPASSYGVIGRTETAYFKMINEQGGVNGRKIKLISVDDGYSPPKTVEQVRRLVEQEQVAFLFQTLGTPPTRRSGNICNDNRVPQLFVATGATMLGDPKHILGPSASARATRPRPTSYARHILATKPDAKIGVLYQNDDYGKDYLIGLKDGARRGACGHGRQGGLIRGFRAYGRLRKSSPCKARAQTCS